MSVPASGPSRRYSVEFSRRADRDVVAAVLRFREIEGAEIALEWFSGLRSAVDTLSTLPYRYVLLPRESRLIGLDVRRLLYRRTPHSVAYLVFYVIWEEEGSAARVTVLHVRHGARKPLTVLEAQGIRSDV